MKTSKILTGALLLFAGVNALAQGSISGNMETNFQYLLSDDKINAIQPDEKALLNSYINVNYRLAGFKAGVRLEGYLPRTLGYPDRFEGAGLGYRYVGRSEERRVGKECRCRRSPDH